MKREGQGQNQPCMKRGRAANDGAFLDPMHKGKMPSVGQSGISVGRFNMGPISFSGTPRSLRNFTGHRTFNANHKDNPGQS